MAIALVAHAIDQSGGSDAATTASIDTTGATLLVIVHSSQTTSSGISVSDSKSNTWTQLTSQQAGNGNVTLFYVANPTVGSGHTFSGDAGLGYHRASIAVLAFSGVATTTPFDQQNGGIGSVGTSVATGSVTPSEDNEVLVYGCGGGWGNPISVDIGTLLDSAQVVASVAYGVASAYQIQTTATARNPTFTHGNPFGLAAAAAIATFKAAAAGTTYDVAVAEGSASAVDTPAAGLVLAVTVAEGSATAADATDAALVAFAFPIADITAGGWLGHDPDFGGSPPLYEMLDELGWIYVDYIYSPDNPTTQQFEVKLAPLGDPGVNTGHGVNIGVRAMNYDTAFDFDLVQGTTVLDSWTENVTVAEGNVLRTHDFSGAVVSAITDRSDLRIRGVARAP